MGFNPPCLFLALGLLSFPGAGQADDGLFGRTVMFKVMTYDDPATPYLNSAEYQGVVGDGPEFGMTPEGHFMLDVVPVTIDVSERRIDFTYPGVMPGNFATADFNGYVLRFPAECVLITGAAIDDAVTTAPLTDADLTITPQSLAINVSGLLFDKHTRIGVTLAVMDCPVS